MVDPILYIEDGKLKVFEDMNPSNVMEMLSQAEPLLEDKLLSKDSKLKLQKIFIAGKEFIEKCSWDFIDLSNYLSSIYEERI